MEDPSLLPYRPAAVLAAFSRASDERVCSPTFRPTLADGPQADPVRLAVQALICCLLVVGVAFARRCGAMRRARGQRRLHADAACLPAATHGRGGEPPALASHFDFWHTDSVPSDLPSTPDRQVA